MAITKDDLEDIFGAEQTGTNPTEEELEFLNKRAQIEEDTFPLLSIEQYEYNYELFCEYGLEEEMLKRVEPHIRYLSRFDPHGLIDSSFYKRFKDTKIVKRYVKENITLTKQPSDK